ncbi:MAG: hypothetical protein OHK0032_09980 [Thermodesulfovibrionales bacterium]
MNRQKAILRLLDGRLIKGYMDNFSPSDESVFIEDALSKVHEVSIEGLKAIFFVRTFEGDKSRSEKKSFAGTVHHGKKVFVRFKDGESMVGYTEGDIPWQRGFFLEARKGKGFFLTPVDSESNNMKIFVVATAVRDVTFLG